MTATPGYTSDLTQGQINSTDLKRCFGGASKGHSTPLVSRFGREILINTNSFEPEMLRFQKSFYDTMAKRHPIELDPETLLSKTGVYADWKKGMAVTGFMASPIGYAPVSNDGIRTNLDLPTEIPSVFLDIVEEVCDICFSEWREADINVTPGSSTGWVGFRNDAEWKIANTTFLFDKSRIQRFLDLSFENKDVEFANEFETIWAYYAQKRDGIDSPDKKRRVYGLKYANDPKAFPDDFQDTDKRVVMPQTGKVWADHSATRERLINAAPWPINAFISVISTGTMKSMFDRFPGVWHVNTPEQVEASINGKHCFFGDASEFDQSHPKKAMDRFHDAMRKYWEERAVHVSEKLFYAPYFSKPLSEDPDSAAGRPSWVGRPFRNFLEVVCGNRSGHSMTALLNKQLMVGAYLYAIHLAGYVVKGNVISWLRGEGIIQFVNNGDDTIITSKNKAALDRVVFLLTDLKTAIYKIEREKGGVYNGMPTVLVDAANLIYKCVPNALNSITKIITPERAIYHPRSRIQRDADLASGKKIHRQFWYLGLGDKIANAHKDDVTADVMDEFVGRWRTEMRGKMTIAEMLDYARMIVPPLSGDLSVKDLQVLEQPDKLHYRFTRDEISTVVLDAVSSKVSSDVFLSYVKTAFTGKFVSKEDWIKERNATH